MKTRCTTLLLLLCSLVLSAQTIDPDFYNQTWYLYQVYDSDFNETFTVQGYQPYSGNPPIDQIAPSVFIEETLEFSGVGICNTFEGTLEQDPTTGDLRTISTAVTTNACGFFEDQIEPYLIGPFGFVNSDPTLFTIGEPQITTDSDGFQTMTYGTQPFIGYTYRNTPVLATPEFNKPIVTVYPNPVQDMLKFQTIPNLAGPINIHLFSSVGTLVYERNQLPSQNFIDINWLGSGLYFLEVATADRKDVIKVVKR